MEVIALVISILGLAGTASQAVISLVKIVVEMTVVKAAGTEAIRHRNDRQIPRKDQRSLL